MTGIGINNMMTSVAIEKPAFANQFCVILIHVPGMLLFQARGIGVHWKIAAKVVATIYDITIESITQQMMRNVFWMKMRR
jgi:hypothetical protein